MAVRLPKTLWEEHSMTGLKHILFPIDFSDRCCAAVPFVEAMASRYNAKVTLISVAEPMFYAGLGDPGGPIVINTDMLLADLEERLAHALTRELAHLHVERVAEIGDPAQVITRFAHAYGVDLIMMPTHGYGPFRSLLLGSVTAKVLHDAQCPIWTAAHVEDRPCQDHLACRSILCAVDGTPKSVSLMQWAAGLAHDLGATLRLLHVVTGAERSTHHSFDPGHDQDAHDRARDAIHELQETAKVNAPLCLVAGTVAQGVHEETMRHGADLVVIGRGVLNGTLGRLRTHAYGIIRQSPSPVLSV
jgi:nucleotide-binding universal stress UspA family protein